MEAGCEAVLSCKETDESEACISSSGEHDVCEVSTITCLEVGGADVVDRVETSSCSHSCHRECYGRFMEAHDILHVEEVGTKLVIPVAKVLHVHGMSLTE